MVGRFLITTADERTWRTDVPVLFLGEWCRLYDRRHVWEKLDAVIAPYHWDDRGKLFSDYKYVSQLYERLLDELSVCLNKFHSVNNSKRSWRLIIGPWLGYFVQILLDRWTMIQFVAAHFRVESTIVVAPDSSEIPPSNMNNFLAKLITDSWNQYIFGRILSGWTDIRCSTISVNSSLLSDNTKKKLTPCPMSFLNWLKSFVIAKITNVSYLTRANDVFLYGSYLTSKYQILVQLGLVQFPKFWRAIDLPTIPPDPSIRSNFLEPLSKERSFENFVRTMVGEQIPVAYLEGFRDIQDVVSKGPWPAKPKSIFCSNPHISDDIFKIWAASKIEHGSKLYIGQHGGNYGTSKWSFMEDHELAICDRYFTWGWGKELSRIYKLGATKLFGSQKCRRIAKENILLIMTTVPRYSYHLYSGMVSSQMTSYLDDLFRFVDELPMSLRKQLTVRLYEIDYDWSQQARWQDHNSEIQIDNGQGPILPFIMGSRICVSSYNATTFLETIALDVPTIIFWNPNHWELREEAEPYFELLKQVGIYHQTPGLAAAKIVDIWDDVENWWNGPSVREALTIFSKEFVFVPDKPLKELLRPFRSSVK